MRNFHTFKFPIRPLASLLILLILPGSTLAARYKNPLDFSLQLGSTTTHWVYLDSTRETRLNTITARWSQAISPSVRGGVKVSYLDMTQGTNPQAVGLDATGNGLGIDLHVELLDTERVQLDLLFAYDYARTDNALDGQEIENSWLTASLGLDGALRLSKAWYFLAGAGVVSVSGEERLSGDSNQLTTFSEETAEKYYAGLRLQTDNSGHIDLRWYGGYQEGLVLNFERHY